MFTQQQPIGYESDELQAIHERLFKLWADQKHSELVPMIYPTPTKGTLVFIGINPSFCERDILRLIKGTYLESIIESISSVRSYFTFDQKITPKKLNDFQYIHRLYCEKYHYFKRHHELAKAVGIDTWEQIDLYQIRMSEQAELMKKIKDNKQDPFFTDQLTIFFNLLELINPKVIVIVNGKTGRILRSKRFRERVNEFTLEPTSKKSIFLLHFKEQCVPVIFSIHVAYKPKHEQELINQQLVESIKEVFALHSQTKTD